MPTKQTMITDTLWLVSKWLEPETDGGPGDSNLAQLLRYLVWYMDSLDAELAQRYINCARDLIYELGAEE